MYAANISRKELLGWLGGQSMPATKRLSRVEQERIAPQEIMLAWRDKPASEICPCLIVVPRESLGDFYAFISTYVSTYSPFSAFFRVTTPDHLAAYLKTDKQPGAHQQGLIGVAIAEAFVQARGKAKSTSDLSLPAVLGTLSATLAMALHRGYRPEQLEDIAIRWGRARNLNSDDDLVLSPSKTVQAWCIIAQAMLPEPTFFRGTDAAHSIAAFLRSARTNNGAIAELLYPLTARFPLLGDSALRMRGTREDRVRILGEAVISLINSDGDSILKEFLAGTLVSLLGNGSFDYLPFATKLTRDLPGAALWFGISSALQKGSDALTAANCLGRRAARDAFAPWSIFDTPRDDISIEELEMTRRSDAVKPTLRGGGQSILSIELVPGVSAKVRGTGGRNDPNVPETTAWKQDSEEMRELRYALDRASQTLARMEMWGRQPDLFDPDSRPSRRRR